MTAIAERGRMPRVRRTPTRSAVDGALALAAAMGIGRFAYTALLPPTQQALGIGDDVAGALLAAGAVALGGLLLVRAR